MLSLINAFIWGAPLLALFLGSGIYFTIKTRFIQFRGLIPAFRAIRQDIKSGRDARPGISPTSGLLTALGAVMGPGNLIGVCSALVAGGPGAIFWMWVSALLGMASRYVESFLSVKHRRCEKGVNFGGPMYVMRDMGFGKTAVFFALLCIFDSLAMANALPSAGLAAALQKSASIPTWACGLALSLLAFLTVLGGLKRISDVAGYTVPIMSIIFIGAALLIIALHPAAALAALAKIFASAFSLKSGIGGLIGTAVRYGMARGIYSNEAGMGTEPILAAATNEPSPHRQALISMTGVFLDTVVFCTFTAIVAVMAGIDSTDAASMTSASFYRYLSVAGRFIVDVTLTFLVFATVTSWSYYGESALAYFSGGKKLVPVYRFIYCVIPFIAAGRKLSVLLEISDIATALMSVPNLIVCIKAIKTEKLLSGAV